MGAIWRDAGGFYPRDWIERASGPPRIKDGCSLRQSGRAEARSRSQGQMLSWRPLGSGFGLRPLLKVRISPRAEVQSVVGDNFRFTDEAAFPKIEATCFPHLRRSAFTREKCEADSAGFPRMYLFVANQRPCVPPALGRVLARKAWASVAQENGNLLSAVARRIEVRRATKLGVRPRSVWGNGNADSQPRFSRMFNVRFGPEGDFRHLSHRAFARSARPERRRERGDQCASRDSRHSAPPRPSLPSSHRTTN